MEPLCDASRRGLLQKQIQSQDLQPLLQHESAMHSSCGQVQRYPRQVSQLLCMHAGRALISKAQSQNTMSPVRQSLRHARGAGTGC